MYYLGLFLSVILMAASVKQKPLSLTEGRALISPPPQLEYFSFGFQMPLADSLWVRALQDFDFCENLLAKNLCVGNGWLSRMLDTLTNLAPDYDVVYRAGGLALTVLVSDYPGASRLFDKGVMVFPNDHKLLAVAGYHAMIEEKNNEKAAGLFVRAAKAGGVDWYYSLATRLLVQGQKKQLAQELYQQLSEDGISEGILRRMKEKIEATK